MVLSLFVALVVGQAQPDHYRLLFLGNSHTGAHDLTGQVASLLRSTGAKVEYKVLLGGGLDALEPRSDVRNEIDRGRYSHVVLQGASISSSHKHEYPLDFGIALAKRAAKAGAKPLLFAEWPRRGWDESDYIYRHYETIRKQGGGEVVPIPYAWDAALRSDPKLDLWSSDGNHTNLPGSYLAACTISLWIVGTKVSLAYVPPGLSRESASSLMNTARSTVNDHRRLGPRN